MKVVDHEATTIGLISDTHGLLRDEALAALHGSDLIIHAGDVGDPGIIHRLSHLAKVVAVRGNVDTESWASALPESAVVETSTARILVLHNVHDLSPANIGYDIVISGHSHRPGRTQRDGILFINPGSAGPRRFKLPITVARLNLSRKPWSPEFIQLIDPASR